MASTSVARPRALGLLRHAIAAAGLGLGWLLLSGPAASAMGDPLGAESLLEAPLSSVSSVVAPLTESGVESAPSALVESTTTTLAETVEAVPPAVAPVLTGPLEPLAPVVSGASSDVGGLITTVGDTVGSVGATVGDVVDAVVPTPLPLPEPPPAPVLTGPLPGPVAPPASAPAPESAPVHDAIAPAASPASPGGPASVDPAGIVVSARALLAWGWSMPDLVAAPPAVIGSATVGPPDDAPDGPWTFPLFDRQLWLGSGPTGSFGGGFTTTAMLAAALVLPALLLLTVRKRPYAGSVPASPAFDPGSTPD